MYRDKTPLVDCKFVPATTDPDYPGRPAAVVVKCNPYERDVLHGCDRCGFNPKVAAERMEKGSLVKGKDGLQRLVW